MANDPHIPPESGGKTSESAAVGPESATLGPVGLARYVVEHFVSFAGMPSVPSHRLEEWLNGPARGVFVCLKERNQQLRGCIGSVDPVSESLREEIITSAVAAASRDPRFSPVSPAELADLTYTVDILQIPQPVVDLEELDPEIYGVIVSLGVRRGLLLPSIEGVASVEEQVEIARRKAGIGAWEDYALMRFTVDRYSDESTLEAGQD